MTCLTIAITTPSQPDLKLVEYVPPPTGWVPIAHAQIENIRDLVEKAGCKHAAEASDEALV